MLALVRVRFQKTIRANFGSFAIGGQNLICGSTGNVWPSSRPLDDPLLKPLELERFSLVLGELEVGLVECSHLIIVSTIG